MDPSFTFFNCTSTDHHHIPCTKGSQDGIVDLTASRRIGCSGSGSSSSIRSVCVECVEQEVRNKVSNGSQPLADAFGAIAEGCARLIKTRADSDSWRHGGKDESHEVRILLPSLSSLAQRVFLFAPEVSANATLYAATLHFFSQFIYLLQRYEDEDQNEGFSMPHPSSSTFSSSFSPSSPPFTHAFPPHRASEDFGTHEPRHLETLVTFLLASLRPLLLVPIGGDDGDSERPDAAMPSGFNGSGSTQERRGEHLNMSHGAVCRRESKGPSPFSARLLFLSDLLSNPDSSTTRFFTHILIARGLYRLLTETLAETTGRRVNLVNSPNSTQHTHAEPELFCLGSSQEPIKPQRKVAGAHASAPPSAEAHSCELALFILCQLLHLSLECVCGVCHEQWAAALSTDHYDDYVFIQNMTAALEQFYRDHGTVSNALMLLNTLHSSTLSQASMLSPFHSMSLALQNDDSQRQQKQLQQQLPSRCLAAHTNLIRALTPLFLHTDTPDVVVWTAQVLIHELRLLQSLSTRANVRSEYVNHRDRIVSAKPSTLGLEYSSGGIIHGDASSFSSGIYSQSECLASGSMTCGVGVQADSSLHDWVADYVIETLRVHQSGEPAVHLVQLLNALPPSSSSLSSSCRRVGGGQSSLSAFKVQLALATHDAAAFTSLMSGLYFHQCLGDAFDASPDEVTESIVCIRSHVSFSQFLQLLWSAFFWRSSTEWLNGERGAAAHEHGWMPFALSQSSAAALSHAIVLAAPRVKPLTKETEPSASSPTPSSDDSHNSGIIFALEELSPSHRLALACVTLYLLCGGNSSMQGLAEDVVEMACREGSSAVSAHLASADGVAVPRGAEHFPHSHECLAHVGQLAVVGLIVRKITRCVDQSINVSGGMKVVNGSARNPAHHHRIPTNLVDVVFRLTSDIQTASEKCDALRMQHLLLRERLVCQLLRIGGIDMEGFVWCHDALVHATCAQDFVLRAIVAAPGRACYLLYCVGVLGCSLPPSCAAQLAELVVRVLGNVGLTDVESDDFHVRVAESDDECDEAILFVNAVYATVASFLWFDDTFPRDVEREELSTRIRTSLPVKPLIRCLTSSFCGEAQSAVDQLRCIPQVHESKFLYWLVGSGKSSTSLRTVFYGILSVALACPLDAKEEGRNGQSWIDAFAECACNQLEDGQESQGSEAHVGLLPTCLEVAFELLSNCMESVNTEAPLVCSAIKRFILRCVAIRPAQASARLLSTHLGPLTLQQLARLHSFRKAEAAACVGAIAEIIHAALASESSLQQQHNESDHTLWKWAFLHAESHTSCVQVLYLLLHRQRGKELARSNAEAVALLIARLRTQNSSQSCRFSPPRPQASLAEWVLEMSMRRWSALGATLLPSSALCQCAAFLAAASERKRRQSQSSSPTGEMAIESKQQFVIEMKVGIVSAALCFFHAATDAQQSAGLPLLDLLRISADLIAEEVALDVCTRFFSIAVRTFPQLSDEPVSVSVFLWLRQYDDEHHEDMQNPQDKRRLAYMIFRSRVLVALLESSPLWLQRSGVVRSASALLRQWVTPKLVNAEISASNFVHPVSAKEELTRLVTACESYFSLRSSLTSQEWCGGGAAKPAAGGRGIAAPVDPLTWDALRVAYHAVVHLLSTAAASSPSMICFAGDFVNPMRPSNDALPTPLRSIGDADAEHFVSLVFPRALLAIV